MRSRTRHNMAIMYLSGSLRFKFVFLNLITCCSRNFQFSGISVFDRTFEDVTASKNLAPLSIVGATVYQRHFQAPILFKGTFFIWCCDSSAALVKIGKATLIF